MFTVLKMRGCHKNFVTLFVIEIKSVKIQESKGHGKDMETIKERILDFVITRFTRSTNSAESVLHPITKKNRRIVTYDILKDKNYVLSTLLDPTYRTVPFHGTKRNNLDCFTVWMRRHLICLFVISATFSTGTGLEKFMLTENEAKQILEMEYQSRSPAEVEVLDPPQPHSNTSSHANVDSDEFLDYLNQIAIASSTQPDQPKDEIDMYLGMDRSRCQVKESPLEFWRKHQEQFPVLSKIAVECLTMPATSASVERLFSVAKCTSGNYRNQLTIQNVENLLLCQQSFKEN